MLDEPCIASWQFQKTASNQFGVRYWPLPGGITTDSFPSGHDRTNIWSAHRYFLSYGWYVPAFKNMTTVRYQGGTQLHPTSSLTFIMNLCTSHFCRGPTATFITSWSTFSLRSLRTESAITLYRFLATPSSRLQILTLTFLDPFSSLLLLLFLSVTWR